MVQNPSVERDFVLHRGILLLTEGFCSPQRVFVRHGRFSLYIERIAGSCFICYAEVGGQVKQSNVFQIIKTIVFSSLLIYIDWIWNL